MGQEQAKGYYVDVYLQLAGLRPASGNTPSDGERKDRVFDVDSYFASALEHTIIEQLQATNLVAASTVKMLQLANTNGLKVFLANAANWTSITNQLTSYDLAGLYNNLISWGRTLLLPSDGFQYVAGSGTWRGYGLVSRFITNQVSGGTTSILSSMTMLIGGNYNGGYVSQPGPPSIHPTSRRSTTASRPISTPTEPLHRRPTAQNQSASAMALTR
jgi:hypothetical protein